MTKRVRDPGRKTSIRKKRAARPTKVILTPGARAANDWFEQFRLATVRPWYVEIALDVVKRPAKATYSVATDTRFHLNVYPEEWGVFFCHASRASWIRVTDEPFVHGRDDHRLLEGFTTLLQLGTLLGTLEQRHQIHFERSHALVRTNVAKGKDTIREWVGTL